jgi:deazaflavin-dependent oxidoreductase (nitroreductase family)
MGVGFTRTSGVMQLLKRLGVKNPIIHAMSRSHVWMYQRTGGRFGGNPGFPSLLLTTTGRTSGQPRTVALLYLADGDRIVLVASYGGDDKHPQWYRNLVANPRVTVQMGAEVRTMTAHEADDRERAGLWSRLNRGWPSFSSYQASTTRRIPIVILEETP